MCDLLTAALREVSPALVDTVQVVSVPGTSRELYELCNHADVVSVYGSDETVAAVRRQLGRTTRLLPHGHGVSLAWVPARALSSAARARAAARALSIDIAAYDQRGCLSPQGVWV